MIEIEIYRKGELLTAIKPDGTSSQKKEIMGENVISLSFEVNQIIDFKIGDYTVVFGETYFLASAPSVQKKSQYNYLYNMTMILELPLKRAQLMFYDATNQLKEGDFSLTGTAEIFIDLLVKNVNRIESGWVKGGVTNTGTKTITFSKIDCHSALAQIAEAFGMEYYIEGKKVHLAKLQTPTPYRFKYGRNKGLYTITRAQVEGTEVCTRLYAFGGEKNLPPAYPSNRLRLPGGYDYMAHDISWTIEAGNTKDALPVTRPLNTIVISFTVPTSPEVAGVYLETRYKGNSTFYSELLSTSTGKALCLIGEVFEGRIVSKAGDGTVLSTTPLFEISPVVNPVPTAPIIVSNIALPYLENNTEVYGIIEANYINDDIYPTRTGVVTAIDGASVYRFSDTTMNFDVNGVLLPGVTAKLTFNTGQLAGYTFELSKYNHSIKQFSILKNKDEKALDLPSPLMRPAIGDEYVLTDIEMPLAYVQDAEKRLQAKAQEYLDLYSNPVYQYNIECDPAWFRAQMIKMNIGDVVWLTDNELQVEKYTRVISLNKSLIDEYQYELQLGDVIGVGTLQSIIQTQFHTAQGVNSVASQVNNNALLNGYLICPEAVDTSAMKALFVDSEGKIWKQG